MPLNNPRQNEAARVLLPDHPPEREAGKQEERARIGLTEIDATNTAHAPIAALNVRPLATVPTPQSMPPFAAAKRPQAGLIAAFSNACYRWNIPEEDHLVLLGFGDNHFLGEQILYGRLAAPQDTRARASCVLSISISLGALFNEDVAAERHWLTTASERLDGKPPLTFMLEGEFLNLFVVRREVERAQGLK